MNKIAKVLCTLGAATTLVGCSFNFQSSETRNEEIYSIYVMYQENGGTLTYEEWLASIKGEKGDKGDKGDTGETGATGATGAKGDKGDPGNDGEDGLTPYIGTNGNWWIGVHDTGVSANGNKGDKGDTGATGAKGDKGDAGNDGEDGLTPYIGTNGNWWIGETDTGVSANGNKGDKGDTGETGAQGEKGDTGETGAKGDKGDQGDAGKDGADGLSAYELFKKTNEDYPYDEATWIYDLSHGKLGEHTLFLNSNGGTLEEGYQTSYSNLHYWSALSLKLPNVTRNKYRFDGWYNEDNGSRCGGSGDTYNFYLSVDTTITARWTYVGAEGEKPAIVNPSSNFNFDHSLIVEDGSLFTYETDYDHDGIMISGFSESYDHQTYLSIPDTIDDKKVTKIKPGAFWQCETFSYISIPQYCVEIGILAFSETYLKEVDFTRCLDLETIGDDSFSHSQICNLTGLSGLDCIVKISDNAFTYNKLTSFELNGNENLEYIGSNLVTNNPLSYVYLIDLPKLTYLGAFFAAYTSITEVKMNYCPSFTSGFGQNCFWNCHNLKTVDLSYNENLESLGAYLLSNDESLREIYLLGVPKLSKVNSANATFENTKYVKDIYYGGTKEQWESIEGIKLTNENKYLFMATMHYGSSKVTYVNKEYTPAISKECPETLGFKLNSDETGYVVTGIGSFEGSMLYIGGTYKGLPIVEIGAQAFRYVDTLTDIFIGDSITKIGKEAFQHIPNTTNVYFCSKTVPTFVSDTFGYTWGTSAFNIYCPEDCYEDYSAVTSDPYWQQYALVSLKSADLDSLFVDRFSSSFEIVEKSVGTITLPVLSQEGYTFDGWFYDAEFNNPVEGNPSVTDDLVVYAKWTKNN